MTPLVVAVGLFGLLIGSFLNVVIWRVPRGESVVSPPSHCPACDHQLRAVDNVPLLSWLLLRGRCRYCGAPISVRYPLVEGATGLVFAVVAAAIGPDPALPAFLYLAGVGMALAVIDLDTRRLPNALTLPSYPIMIVLLAVPAALTPAWSSWFSALAGGLALFAFYLLLAFLVPRGMGMGDVKFAGVLGLGLGWLGWGAVVVGGFLGFLLGAVVGLVLMIVRRARRGSTIPFGPFMYVGALLAIVYGPRLADWYLGSVLGL